VVVAGVNEGGPFLSPAGPSSNLFLTRRGTRVCAAVGVGVGVGVGFDVVVVAMAIFVIVGIVGVGLEFVMGGNVVVVVAPSIALVDEFAGVMIEGGVYLVKGGGADELIVAVDATAVESAVSLVVAKVVEVAVVGGVAATAVIEVVVVAAVVVVVVDVGVGVGVGVGVSVGVGGEIGVAVTANAGVVVGGEIGVGVVPGGWTPPLTTSIMAGIASSTIARVNPMTLKSR